MSITKIDGRVNEEISLSEEVNITSDTPWRVIVSNDPVNLIHLVAIVFQRVLKINKELAMEYTMKVHNEGRCAVFHGDKEECTRIAEILMSYQLWTHIEKDE